MRDKKDEKHFHKITPINKAVKRVKVVAMMGQVVAMKGQVVAMKK